MAGEARVDSLGHYEMLWDCAFCGATKLLGKTHRFCPECGAQQDATRRYMPPEGEGIKVENHRFVGTDRHCPACSSPQSAVGKNCGNCGSPMDGAVEVKKVVDAKPAPPKPKRRAWIWLVVGAVVLAALLTMCLWKKTKAFEVVGHAWQRSVAIEEWKDVRDSAWRDQLPSGARDVSCHRAQRSTKQIPDGEDCTTERKDKGDGTFEQVQKCTPKYRREGVDDDQCSYLDTRWVKSDGPSKEGRGMAPAWPQVTLRSAPGLGQQREAGRTETFTLELKDKDGDVTRCDVAEAVWQRLADGAKVKAKVGGVTGRVSCSSLQ